ncbi:hypothetical protein C2857_001274 [Epichloe festucae Fl1]|uniref:Uncharacterized protein n=1 Tax=Epichloe festucae (strain Fl1) TaxID=877507 RepID=A0A7S9PT96_EPIFF|nr:hypothetical protein C2857_001274 [Epichloe festucae Fl1]
MKLLASIVTVVAMVSSVEACKCVGPNGNNVDATNSCCTQAGGSPSDGDCPSNLISQTLSNFASCCSGFQTKSDCTCPFGCARAELEAKAKKEGKTPPTAEEVKAFVASYE